MPGGTSGTSAEYYKCASVYTSAKTWSGYKAVLNNGVYTFESTVTSGLTYTSVTPVVGNIYSADALVQIAYMAGNIPESGLVFYAPLKESKTTAETGQTLNVTGSISYQSIYGIPCAYFNGESYLSGDDSAFPTGSEPFTVSCFVFVTTKTSSMYPSIFHWGLNQVGKAFEIHIYSQDDNIFGEILSYNGVSSGYENKLFHVTVTSTGNSLKIYYNGVLKNSMDIVPSDYNIVNSIFYIGTGNNRGTFYPFNGYVSSVRVYNRVLSESEISALANEFNVAGGQ
ncbi:MAG: LamG domain-containing protein [Lachnospiraceae bacterium]